MGIINKIRDKSWLIVGLIGLAMLAFILENYKSIFNSGEGKYGVGLMHGSKIDVNRYNQLCEIVKYNTVMRKKSQLEQQTGVQTDSLPSLTDEDLRNCEDQAFGYLADSLLMDEEYNQLEISVSDEEVDAYLLATNGFEINDNNKAYFTDSLTGTVTEASKKAGRDKIKSELKQIRKKKGNELQEIVNQRKRDKYLNILKSGQYITKLELDMETAAINDTKSITLVVKKYSEVNDSEVKVSNEELEKYYEEHKLDGAYFNHESTREVYLVEDKITPSKQDSLAFNKTMATLRSKFKKATNDSTFILKESDSKRFYTGYGNTAPPSKRIYPAGGYEKEFKTIDSIVQYTLPGGPDGDTIVLAKVKGFAPSFIGARHIRINLSTAISDSTSKKDPMAVSKKRRFADSLYALALRDTSKFSELVNKHSDDVYTKMSGGKIDNVINRNMGEAFTSYCISAPLGTIGLFKQKNNLHIIQVMTRDSIVHPRLNTVSKVCKASELTESEIEGKTASFLTQLNAKLGAIKASDVNRKIAAFESEAKAKGLLPQKMVLKDNYPSLTNQMMISSMAEQKILEFAFDDEVASGDLIAIPVRDKNRFIIALKGWTKAKGIPTFGEVKMAMRQKLIDDKKAAKLIAEMAKFKDILSYTKANNTKADTLEISFANGGNLMGEPELWGYLFSGKLKAGQTSAPIKGLNGVYMIQINANAKKSNTPPADPVAMKKQLLDTRIQQMFNNQNTSLNYFSALYSQAGFVDNRKLTRIRP
jgi:hypothetical protein